MDEAGHQARAGERVLFRRACALLSASSEGANVHPQLNDTQQRLNRKTLWQVCSLARRNINDRRRSIRGLQQDYAGIMLPAVALSLIFRLQLVQFFRNSCAL